jgi:hypothetical protein
MPCRWTARCARGELMPLHSQSARPRDDPTRPGPEYGRALHDATAGEIRPAVRRSTIVTIQNHLTMSRMGIPSACTPPVDARIDALEWNRPQTGPAQKGRIDPFSTASLTVVKPASPHGPAAFAR